MRPARGKVLVQRVETEETLPGGSIIFTQRAQEEWAQWQVEVIAVGEPSICAKPKKCLRPHRWEGRDLLLRPYLASAPITEPDMSVPPFSEVATHRPERRLAPGAWCIIRHRSLVPVGSDDKRFLCNQEDVLGVFGEGAVITQAGQSHVMSMEERHRIAEREIDRRANERYGDASY